MRTSVGTLLKALPSIAVVGLAIATSTAPASAGQDAAGSNVYCRIEPHGGNTNVWSGMTDDVGFSGGLGGAASRIVAANCRFACSPGVAKVGTYFYEVCPQRNVEGRWVSDEPACKSGSFEIKNPNDAVGPGIQVWDYCYRAGVGRSGGVADAGRRRVARACVGRSIRREGAHGDDVARFPGRRTSAGGFRTASDARGARPAAALRNVSNAARAGARGVASTHGPPARSPRDRRGSVRP